MGVKGLRICMADRHSYQRFDLNQVAQSFPDTAETMLLDTYLTDREAASARVFRVYRDTPPHYHAGSDEYLYVLSGRGTFWMSGPLGPEQSLLPATCFSLSAALFMPCPRSWRSQ